ncbi:MAG: 30S ribosomal protein S12 methylthiotransferase RimO [Oscillospiraceae bacterium]|nr:30S ribosomal protein S12 methylthiotransferase RimO [Oscillospiraceae bacterium]
MPTETVGLISLGCAKNRVDSEQMLGLLRQAGHPITTDLANAEILIVNTCGFIGKAKEEAINTLLGAARYKTDGVCRTLIAAGCLVQRYADALREEMPEIDALIGVTEYPRLAEIIDGIRAARLNGVVTPDGVRAPVVTAVSPVTANTPVFECAPDTPRVITQAGAFTYVRIADGCDNRCAYCAIPLIRGPYRSRLIESVLDESARRVEDGVRELVFISQDTTRFGMKPGDSAARSRLPLLLRRAARLPGEPWVRAMYCHPARVTDDLLDTLAHTPGVCPYLDVPLQHVDRDVLRRMNRWGDPDSILRLLEKARGYGLTLRTTFLVGFPGEDDAAFRRLYDFAESFGFDRMGAFAFSPEEGTPAFDMPDAPPESVGAERLDALMRMQRSVSLARNKSREGGETDVLIERIAPHNASRADKGLGVLYEGRSQREAPESDGVIKVRSVKPLVLGGIARVRITRARHYDLEGEAI